MTTDRIEVRGLELLVFCGVLPEEQQRQQPFIFDLDIYAELGPASKSDDLVDTVDYGAVIADLATSLQSERFQLLERMAGFVAERILVNPLVAQVTVSAHKLRPPVPQHVATTGVRVHRPRQ